MSKVAERPFRECRPRKPGEKPRRGDTAGDCGICKLPFSAVAVKRDGKKVFYWCKRCDLAGKK